MAVQVKPSGPIPAEIMIVGEAPGEWEERRGEPFVGPSGDELNRMLAEVGISRSQCFVTNVARERPLGNEIEAFIPKRKADITPAHIKCWDKKVTHQITDGIKLLGVEIGMVKPKMIIALGGTALWALTGKSGILKWRGSMLKTPGGIRLIPTVHPAMILRQWEFRAMAVQDLRRAAKYVRTEYPDPGWHFIVRPTFEKVCATLDLLLGMASRMPTTLELSFDLETRAGHIACAGISWTLQDGISIPFMCVERSSGYWNLDEENYIIFKLRQLLTHSNVLTIGQNFLYDSQYTYRHWHFVPRAIHDTMITQHVAYPGLKKSLAFQASMYCEQYVYWKDDGKVWDKKMGEESLWAYNIEDCVRTQECRNVEAGIVARMGLAKIDAAQQEMFWPVLQAMQRGVRIRKEVRNKMGLELIEEMNARESWLTSVIGHPLNPGSSKQMQAFFYDDLKMPIVINRKTGRPSLDEEALTRLSNREPLLKGIVRRILEYRSLGVFLGTFVQAPLDIDGRMRCSYNICGTDTYRLSSSKNAFDSGTNLQNVPKGSKAKEADDLELPNIRKMFGPDEGYEFFDLDLDRADLQVVVWEADDADLKLALRMGVDMHLFNAVDIYRIRGIPRDELVESHPNYKEHRSRIGEEKRQRTKSAVHAVDYACKGRTLAITLGSTVAEADDFIAGWLSAHPGIKRWHESVENDLRVRRKVRNKYGYERFFFERTEGMLPEALAWIPQSTVAVTINKIWKNIFSNLPEVWVLLQVHDSLAGQYPIGYNRQKIKEQSAVIVPYDDPLIIPVGIKTSPISWGDCG